MTTSDDLSAAIEQIRSRIPEDLFTFSFSRSSGPGGQNVNKVSTRVTLFFDLAGSAALDDSEKRRIGTRLSGRISKVGQLRVISMRHRTQIANRQAAIDHFYELLAAALAVPKPRTATRVPGRARRARLRDKRARSEVKNLRARPSGDDGR